ncbi:M20 family metallopeptidase [Aspergillus lucknowensis]|uniref:Peptidase M20 dimerisation domain-containing protein n=1 Tax=Aspergillus lucknowensis TaxID=176173 RepID=A0ABR4M2I3_9EURO
MAGLGFRTLLALAIGLAAALFSLDALKANVIDQFAIFTSDAAQYTPNQSGICHQVPALSPSNAAIEQFIRDKTNSPAYHNEIITKLTGIIQIPSESYDDLGPIGADPRWDVFYQIETYLKAQYPAVFETVTLDHANTHGLTLTWEGSVPASEAKPILLLAHQDVVPVLPETVAEWTHPPYEGFFDGEVIWGRGATDDKGYMISVLESIDLLIKAGFRPQRTVILAFGCDEEISGENCGRPISEHLHAKYGDEGIYLIIDEGSVGIQREFGQSFAMVSVAEKGYLDVGIDVSSTGGHASNPPDHNVIGILAEIIKEIEDHPFEGRVTAQNPMFGFLECAAVHAPQSNVPGSIRRALSQVARGNTHAERRLAKELDDLRYYFRTSQSVGKISGGLKINAIPEHASTMINLRLAVETSVATVQRHYEDLIVPIAAKHNMTLEGFNDSPSHAIHRITLSAIDPLEPAPVSPASAEAFRVLSGTIKNTLSPLENDTDLIVTPYLMPANTDTKFFWRLTRNIYRFTPLNLVHNLNRAHTVDEFIRAAEFVREPLFFASLVLNVDDLVDS